MEKYIKNLMSKVNGMRMWAKNGYDCIGTRAVEDSETDGILNLFAGTIYKGGSEIKSLDEIDDSCFCDLMNQIVVAGRIVRIELGKLPITDVEKKDGEVYFTVKEV